MEYGGEKISREVKESLENFETRGLCKVVFGDYGTGKSHYLHLVNAAALKSGWATSYLEFDPKAVDPAKPYLVYREIISKLEFPGRQDGSRSDGFHDLIKEIRKNWQFIRDLPNLNKNPWFRNALEVLQFYPHNEERDFYMSSLSDPTPALA